MSEEKGLVLWDDWDADLTLNELARKLCLCGEPAVEAVRRVDAPGDERVYLCVLHRRRIGPGVPLA